MTDNPRPPLPVEDMLDALIGDTSSDYNDGDHPGYYRHVWLPATGRLTLHYEPEGVTWAIVSRDIVEQIRANAELATTAAARERDLRAELRRRDDLIGHLRMALDRAERSVRDLADAHRPEKCAPSEVERLRALLGEVLPYFAIPGHPGVPCHRTDWIPDRTLADWCQRAGL